MTLSTLINSAGSETHDNIYKELARNVFFFARSNNWPPTCVLRVYEHLMTILDLSKIEIEEEEETT